MEEGDNEDAACPKGAHVILQLAMTKARNLSKAQFGQIFAQTSKYSL